MGNAYNIVWKMEVKLIIQFIYSIKLYLYTYYYLHYNADRYVKVL